MAERDAGEADGHVGADPLDRERRTAHTLVIAGHDLDVVGQDGELAEQLVHLRRLRAVVERLDQLDRPGDLREVGLQLLGEGGVKHACSLGGEIGGRNGGADTDVWARSRRGGPELHTERVGEARGGTGSGRSHPEVRLGGRSLRSCRRGPARGRGCRRPLPTWPGRPRSGAHATYWAALILRSSSTALRPTPSGVISRNWITPSGSTRKVPRSARP